MKAYFFDLDGTLADAREGLYASFRAALKALDVAERGDQELERFLGTPLPEMFRVLKPGISKTLIAGGWTRSVPLTKRTASCGADCIRVFRKCWMLLRGRAPSLGS
jgi:hypothetical protein